MDLSLIEIRAAFLNRRLEAGEIPITTVAQLAQDVTDLIARVRELTAEIRDLHAAYARLNAEVRRMQE